MKLSDFAFDEFSQNGEDGMIEEAFRRMGEGGRRFVEFGAADGISCSNTHRLQRADWWGVLIEKDPELAEKAQALALTVYPTGPCSIDAILADFGWDAVDFMSIDIDGGDYQIWEHMEMRPRLLCIEYNRSIPPSVSLRQERFDDCFGQSAWALCELGEQKGYGLVGLTRCNLLFAEKDELHAFGDVNCNLDPLFDYSALTYLVTDEKGRPAYLGEPPWGLIAEPYIGEVVGEALGRFSQVPVNFIDSFEEIFGRSRYLSRHWFNIADKKGLAPYELEKIILDDEKIILIDVGHVGNPKRIGWITTLARHHGYKVKNWKGYLSLHKVEQ